MLLLFIAMKDISAQAIDERVPHLKIFNTTKFPGQVSNI
jgi:hypothetical protein